MNLVPCQEGLLLTFPHLSPLTHATSTRPGGFSQGPFSSLNLGRMSGDDLDLVERNRERFARWLEVPIAQNLKMDHGLEVAHLQGPEDMQVSFAADACISAHPSVSLSLTTADCLPIFFYDPAAQAIGLAHAGWRGTLGGIALRVVQAMVDKLGARPERILAGLGPAILPCCFEVGLEVAQPFQQAFAWPAWVRQTAPDKFHLDLQAANLVWLERAGLRGSNIQASSLCTCCRSDLFFSWRRDGSQTGRMLSAISLKSSRQG